MTQVPGEQLSPRETARCHEEIRAQFGGLRALSPRHRPPAAPSCAGPVVVGELVSRKSMHPVRGGLR
jgi:hypothetical protein